MRLATQKNYRSKNMDAKRQALMTQMSKLSGLDFDQAYMKGRASRATLSRQPSTSAKPSRARSDLKAFAAKTLPTVQEHLQDARNMTGNSSGANQNQSSPRPMNPMK